MFYLTDSSIFRRYIGDRVNSLCGKVTTEIPGSISSLELDMLIKFEKGNIRFKSDRCDGMFENEDGDMFYDYEIEMKESGDLAGRETAMFKTSEISRIDVYGRDFNDQEFIQYPQAYQKVKGLKRTDDLFMFTSVRDERLMIVFGPFLPRIDAKYDSRYIEMFWKQFGERYTLHHTIE